MCEFDEGRAIANEVGPRGLACEQHFVKIRLVGNRSVMLR
jgi:hypothetical protein